MRNFRAFRERAEWSLVASADKTREEDNVIDVPAFGLRLLKSVVVYGANASGKTKLVEALGFMQQFVQESSASGQTGKPTGVEPFRLNPTAAAAASEFEIQFIHQDVLYRYGFEVTAKRVAAEWLFMRAAKRVRNTPEVELFYRTGQDITFHAKQFGGIVGELVKNAAVRENALLLSVAAQFNQPRAVAVLAWFGRMMFLGVGNEVLEKALTLMGLRMEILKPDILQFLEAADLDLTDVLEGKQPGLSFHQDSPPAETSVQLMEWMQQEHTSIKTVHRAYTDAHEPADPVEFSLLQDESTGTQKLLMLAGPVLDALAVGRILVADELDARLHPNLVCKIVHLFNSKATNPLNAQLLFNTHDTNLLASGNFRRDQIWFTEKSRYGEATLYSLADFKTDQVRKDDDFEANYVRGKYGAVPYLGNFTALPTPPPEPAPKHENAG
ncbi:AAA family ATPase [Hymenobacter sp. IS2118]|uniref:AAA family ATPase n=1 Tax=Hymenobacter sp. IS2118 TaxID=1505605 RepID=UPI001F3DBE87|nr:ATP-binding protein [Hymenobacter sp. IS2118]